MLQLKIHLHARIQKIFQGGRLFEFARRVGGYEAYFW